MQVNIINAMQIYHYFSAALRQRFLWSWIVLPGGILGALWFVLTKISLSEVVTTLLTVRPQYLLLLLLVNIVIFFTMTLRWWMITTALGFTLPYLHLTGIRLAANAVSYFTPGPQFGGEPIQVYLLHRLQEIQSTSPLSPDSSVAAMALDRVFELLVNFLFLFFGTILLIQSQLSGFVVMRKAIWIAGLLVLLPIGMFSILCSGKLLLSSVFFWLASKISVFGRWHPLIQDAETRLGSLCRRRPRLLFSLLFASWLNWGCVIGEFWLMYMALGLVLSPVHLFIILTAARLAFLTPFPGGLGALEASQTLILQALAYPPSIGLSVCVLIRIRDVLTGGLGLLILTKYLTQFSGNLLKDTRN